MKDLIHRQGAYASHKVRREKVRQQYTIEERLKVLQYLKQCVNKKLTNISIICNITGRDRRTIMSSFNPGNDRTFDDDEINKLSRFFLKINEIIKKTPNEND